MKVNLFREKQVHKTIRFVNESSSKSDANVDKILEKIPSRIKLGAITALFLLPTIGCISSCNHSNNENENNNIEIVDTPRDTIATNKYLEVTPKQTYIVQQGDSPAKIANRHNVSTIRLLKENNLTSKDIIYPNDTLTIPNAYKIVNVKNAEDVKNLMNFNEEFLSRFIQTEEYRDTIYIDINGNKTTGIGHYIPEGTTFPKKKLSQEEVYTLFAEDLINIELNLEAILGKEVYNKMPNHIRESVIDLAFNRGEGVVSLNKDLRNALISGDYVTAIANMNQDYLVKTDNNKNEKRTVASGLAKRRLFDMSNACKSFKNGIPQQVLDSAKNVYKRGLIAMEEEVKKGIITEISYPNVKAEYKALAYEWFDGKIGEYSKLASTKKVSKPDNSNNNSAKIFVNGIPTAFTVNSLYESWGKAAKKAKREVTRPKPVIDSNGNITALVQVLKPTKNGILSGKTIIINPGHGGAMNKANADGSVNVKFDPGTSNAMMDKKNPNLETNQFIGNGGKSLEEWVVNERISRQLSDKIRSAGGKVIFVQGSVYSAQNAIRDIQKKQNINMILSLHSNSAGESRGIHVLGNTRGGKVDLDDKKLADNIASKLNEHSWFKGITHSASQSLGVLSLDKNITSPVPAVLIETGNLKNETDVANLNSSAFKTQLVESIFASIASELKK